MAAFLGGGAPSGCGFSCGGALCPCAVGTVRRGTFVTIAGWRLPRGLSAGSLVGQGWRLLRRTRQDLLS